MRGVLFWRNYLNFVSRSSSKTNIDIPKSRSISISRNSSLKLQPKNSSISTGGFFRYISFTISVRADLSACFPSFAEAMNFSTGERFPSISQIAQFLQNVVVILLGPFPICLFLNERTILLNSASYLFTISPCHFKQY